VTPALGLGALSQATASRSRRLRLTCCRHVTDHRGGGEGPAAEDGRRRRDASHRRARPPVALRHPRAGDPRLPVSRRLRRQRRGRTRGALARRGDGGSRGQGRGGGRGGEGERAGARPRRGRSAGLPAGRPDGDRGPRRPGDAVRRRLPGPALRQRPLRAAAREARRGAPSRAGWGGGGGALPQASASGDNRRPHSHPGEARRRPLLELLPAHGRGGRAGRRWISRRRATSGSGPEEAE